MAQRNPIREIDERIVKKLLHQDCYSNQEILKIVNDNRAVHGFKPINNGRISEIKNNTNNRYNLNMATEDELSKYQAEIKNVFDIFSEDLMKLEYIIEELALVAYGKVDPETLEGDALKLVQKIKTSIPIVNQIMKEQK